MMVFLGVWDDVEIPYILHENGLISCAEADAAEEWLLENEHEDPEPVLLPLVRRAFVTYKATAAKLASLQGKRAE